MTPKNDDDLQSLSDYTRKVLSADKHETRANLLRKDLDQSIFGSTEANIFKFIKRSYRSWGTLGGLVTGVIWLTIYVINFDYWVKDQVVAATRERVAITQELKKIQEDLRIAKITEIYPGLGELADIIDDYQLEDRQAFKSVNDTVSDTNTKISIVLYGKEPKQ